MRALGGSYKIHRLAHELGIEPGDDPVGQIRQYALKRVGTYLHGAGVTTLEALRMRIAERLSVDLDSVCCDEDFDRIGSEYFGFPLLAARLRLEFDDLGSEGLLLENPDAMPGDRRFLAVSDSRGDKQWRAYFTGWHELAHLLVEPRPHLPEGVRRTPTEQQAQKDPIESVVDDIAGRLAFYEPIFRPALEAAVEAEGGFGFPAIERARSEVAPRASFLSAAKAAMRYADAPALLITAELQYKKAERTEINAPKLPIPGIFDAAPAAPKLRVSGVTPEGEDAPNRIGIFSPMRVPEASILTAAFECGRGGGFFRACECRSCWETSKGGALPRMPLRVWATRRAQYVYGLIMAG